VIVVKELTKDFNHVRAVSKVDFSVKKGSTTALLGGNGAGKTTTISMLLGILTPTAGEIEVLGIDMLKNRYKVLPKMNFSSPYTDLPRRLTVWENLSIYARLYGVKDIAHDIADIGENLEIRKFMNIPFGRLSAGQQTRVLIAKSLLNKPDLLLLDEPTASLDPDTADRVRSYLEEYRKETGATILLASHNMKEVERMCDNVLMMKEGKMVDQGSPDDLVRRYGRKDMEEVFLDVARFDMPEVA